MPEKKWRVAVTQPYIPSYRVPLFQGLVDLLAAESISIRFFCGGDREQLNKRAARNDSAAALAWSEQVSTRTVRLPGSSVRLQHRAIPKEWKSANLLMTELQAGNGNAWESRLMGRPYILLGHGAPYTSHPNRVSEAFEGQLNRRAVHVLTYVPSGRLNVLRDGKVNPAKVTAFMNTTDTRRLADLVSSVSANNVTAFRNDLRIPNTASVALYVGSLTSAKRIDLLCAAAELVLSKHPNTHLIIAGDGPDRHLFEPLRTRYGRVHLLGQSDAQGLALVGAASSFLLNPGRIGLVAVDALVLGLQVLSTRYAFHAPERDYLEEGNTVFYSEDTPADFAELWSHALAGTLPSTRPKWIPTIDHAIETIGQAIIGSLRVSVVSR